MSTNYAAIKTMTEAEVLAELERREPARLRHELEQSRALVAEMTAALGDAGRLCDYLERNRPAWAKLAQRVGFPDISWVGVEPKIARIHAAIAKAREAGP